MKHMAEQELFNRLGDSIEKNIIFKDLVKSRAEIQAKFVGQDMVHVTRAFEFSGDHLSCVSPFPSKIDSNKLERASGQILLSFFLGLEKYFMDTEYSLIAETLIIKAPLNIFHLPRLDHYRIRAPKTFRVLFETTSLNGKLFKVTVPILDLSCGGCKIEVNVNVTNNLFVNKDEIKGHLFLPDRPPIPVLGRIQYFRKSFLCEQIYLTGIQFIHTGEKEKNRINSLVMDLYREFFRIDYTMTLKN